MYTLPAKTSIRIRQPSKQLASLLASVFPDRPWSGKATVELTDWVERSRDPWFHQKTYRWYSFATGGSTPIYEAYRPFEIEPGYALVVHAGGDLTVHLATFSEDPEVLVALDVARDAVLDDRLSDAFRILREALPHGWPLFLALTRKERNLLGMGQGEMPLRSAR